MIHEEIKNLKDIVTIADAIVDYAMSLRPGTDFVQDDNGRYVSRPDNFVTFKVHAKKANNLTVTLRGNPKEFPAADFSELTLKQDQNGYSTFKVTSANQLAAAAVFIRRAHAIFDKGRSREQKGQKVVES